MNTGDLGELLEAVYREHVWKSSPDFQRRLEAVWADEHSRGVGPDLAAESRAISDGFNLWTDGLLAAVEAELRNWTGGSPADFVSVAQPFLSGRVERDVRAWRETILQRAATRALVGTLSIPVRQQFEQIATNLQNRVSEGLRRMRLSEQNRRAGLAANRARGHEATHEMLSGVQGKLDVVHDEARATRREASYVGDYIDEQHIKDWQPWRRRFWKILEGLPGTVIRWLLGGHK